MVRLPATRRLCGSGVARRYAIGSLDEAHSCLGHPVVGARLRKCVGALQHLASSDPGAVFGPVDAMKLRSSPTRFLEAAGLVHGGLAPVCEGRCQ
ncbi:DUF1810 family protein [Sphingomonas sp. 28-62-11]|uniref:DUF1810 family protein n=1 Tax=Sphingomonas sp. 28-62-11 TaxID=1970432 RepID=UPI0035A89561